MKTLVALMFIIGLAAPVWAQRPRKVNGDGYIGCQDWDQFKKLVHYAATGDKEAFQKGLMLALMTGECIKLKADQPVFIVETALLSGALKIRPQGRRRSTGLISRL
ncbi:MAG TPA: hypothetical protein VFC51_12330 [Chloroflexota bacterium]|nr:hypothetical protein [Chloroflexota bacterium]